MEKNEHAIIIDIPNGGKNGKFHSAILTTYAIDLIHFDNYLLNILHRKQISSINVFVDQNQMSKSTEFINPSFVSRIGNDYSISSINTKGAFHCKINFFVGDNAVLVILGSGNLTVTGHGKNHEIFTGFMIDKSDDTQRPLIEECWQYLQKFTSQCSPFDFNRINFELPNNCLYLDSDYKIKPHNLHKIQDGFEVALLYHDSNSSILQQITKIVPPDEITDITIVSPFFDKDGATLLSIAKKFSNAEIHVLIQTSCKLPPCEIECNNQIHFYDFDKTARGKSNIEHYTRQVHAKIIHFESDDAEYCVVGSANATFNGLGSIKSKGNNEEFCVLYKSKSYNFLKHLGIIISKKIEIKIDKIQDMSRHEDNTDSSDDSFIYTLSQAEYENGKLSFVCNKKINDSTLVVEYGSTNKRFSDIRKNGDNYFIEMTLIGDSAICFIEDANNRCISNKVFINRIDLLERTNPSKASRSLKRFISHVEEEGFEGLEIVDMLSEIMRDFFDNDIESNRSLTNTNTSSTKKREKNDTLPDIDFKPKNESNAINIKRTTSTDKTSQLVKCIEDSIKRRIDTIEETRQNTLNDEEEDGDAETGIERDVDNDEIIVTTKSSQSICKNIDSLLSSYINLINKRKEQIKKSSNAELTKDDLNFFSLTIFSALEICCLNRFRYQFESLDYLIDSSYQKELYRNLDSSIFNNGLDVIKRFADFCKTCTTPAKSGDAFNSVATRTMKYAILYCTLFNKMADCSLKFKENEVLSIISSLASVLGLPSIENLEKELTPLSQRYNYEFRISHVKQTIEKLQEYNALEYDKKRKKKKKSSN